MEFDPRAWGRVAQTALVLLVALRLPALAALETPAALLGGLLGATVAAVLVVGVVRAGVGAVSGETKTESEQNGDPV